MRGFGRTQLDDIIRNLKPKVVILDKRFLCLNGPAFYGLAPSKKTFVLRREPQRVLPTIAEGKTVIPLPLGIVPEAERGDVTIPWSVLL